MMTYENNNYKRLLFQPESQVHAHVHSICYLPVSLRCFGDLNLERYWENLFDSKTVVGIKHK